MANTKPFVGVACFCEKVLQEADGVMSAIRIVDTYFVPSEPPAGLPRDAQAIVELNGLIFLKSGDLVGEYPIALVMETTDGERRSISPDGGWPAVFKGAEHGVQIKIGFHLPVKKLGLYWFDVIFSDEVLTRIPLRLREQQSTEVHRQSPAP